MERSVPRLTHGRQPVRGEADDKSALTGTSIASPVTKHDDPSKNPRDSDGIGIARPCLVHLSTIAFRNPDRGPPFDIFPQLPDRKCWRQEAAHPMSRLMSRNRLDVSLIGRE